jgi:hypothetical protein
MHIQMTAALPSPLGPHELAKIGPGEMARLQEPDGQRVVRADAAKSLGRARCPRGGNCIIRKEPTDACAPD